MRTCDPPLGWGERERERARARKEEERRQEETGGDKRRQEEEASLHVIKQQLVHDGMFEHLLVDHHLGEGITRNKKHARQTPLYLHLYIHISHLSDLSLISLVSVIYLSPASTPSNDRGWHLSDGGCAVNTCSKEVAL